jgi:hypothetical protein
VGLALWSLFQGILSTCRLGITIDCLLAMKNFGALLVADSYAWKYLTHIAVLDRWYVPCGY